MTRFLLFPLALACVLIPSIPCRAGELGTIVPAYFYPGTGGPGGGGDGWAAMAAAASQIPLIAVFNPDSGPLPGPADPNYVNAFTNLEAAGGQVVAYIYTDDGATPLAADESEISTYLTQYGSQIDGFFLDGMLVTPSTLSYYQSLDSYIQSLNPSYDVIGNPGQPFLNGVSPTQYLSTGGTFNLYEGSDANYASYPDGLNWFQSYASSQFSNVIYDAPLADVLPDLNQAVSLNTGWVYITDQSLNPPSGYLYDQLPSYWDQEVAEISALNSVPEPRTPILLAADLLALAVFARKRPLRFLQH